MTILLSVLSYVCDQYVCTAWKLPYCSLFQITDLYVDLYLEVGVGLDE